MPQSHKQHANPFCLLYNLSVLTVLGKLFFRLKFAFRTLNVSSVAESRAFVNTSVRCVYSLCVSLREAPDGERKESPILLNPTVLLRPMFKHTVGSPLFQYCT